MQCRGTVPCVCTADLEQERMSPEQERKALETVLADLQAAVPRQRTDSPPEGWYRRWWMPWI